MTDRPLYIAGTSGLALEMFQLATQCGRTPAGFIAEDSGRTGEIVGRASVVGDDAWLMGLPHAVDVILGVGIPGPRLALARRYSTVPSIGFPTLIHPTAVIEPEEVVLGIGNVITAGCIFTVSIEVGDFNLFNWNTTVGHESRIGSGNVINPQSSISGRVTIGDGVLIGTGAQVLEGRSIGDGATVGAGGVVNRNVDPGTTVVGVPARPLGG